MDEESRTYFYKLPPELNSLITNGLDRIYRVKNKDGGAMASFLTFNDSLMMLMKLHGNPFYTPMNKLNYYSETIKQWTFGENFKHNHILFDYHIIEENVGKYLCDIKYYYI